MKARLEVNGQVHDVEIDPVERLSTTLRVRLGLTGTKIGCGVGECGACTVLIGSRPVVACLTITSTVDRPVTTIEGLAEAGSSLRQSFAKEGGFQCGFCTPGQIMAAHAYLDSRGETSGVPGAKDIRAALNGNVCRCTGYAGIVRAVTANARDTDSDV